MSQVAGPSDVSQENNANENALHVGAVAENNLVRIFEREGQKVTVDIQGTVEEPWFQAKQVASLLGYSTSEDISPLFRSYRVGKEKGLFRFQTPGGEQNLLYLSERGLYRFLSRSNKEAALAFQDWVYDVLRTIRLEGRYELQTSQTKLLEDNAAFQSKVEAAEKEAQEVKAKLLEAEKANQKQAEKLEVLRRRVRDQHQKAQSVYLLRNPCDRETQKWKVGKTRDVSTRECQYTTAMPDGPEIVHCRHTTDSGLVEKVVLHILRTYRYEEGHEWMVGDAEYFARVIDCVVNFVDGIVDAGEAVVDFKLHKRIEKLMTRAKNFDPDETGNLSEANEVSVSVNGSVAGSVVGQQITNNVTVVVHNLDDAPKAFIAQKLTRHLAEGRPAKTCAIELSVAVSRFKGWYVDVLGSSKQPSKVIVEKLKEGLGDAFDTTLSKETWTSLTGYNVAPEKADNLRVKLYGYYGWTWKQE